jgi:glycosyltransferase involved in cell wall biosynthesis
MKIALVTGSYPPDTCGVGDYTSRLAQALEHRGVEIRIIRHDSWHMRNTNRILALIRDANPDLVHIQYPTAGFRRHLTPQLLSIAIPSVVTIHEFSEAHILRQLSLYPYFLRSRHVIFTTSFERDFALRRAPWISRRSSVIPVGSAITIGRSDERDSREIVYFGLYRPKKGIEEVLDLALLVKQRNLPYRVRLIGKPFPPGSSYHQELSDRSRDLPVLWSSNLDDQDVANLLSAASFGYMPYPDGASGRRTSLLALLANGVATVTTRGGQTPAELEHAVLFSSSAAEALDRIEEMRRDPVLRSRISEGGREYASRFSWDSIASKHFELYQGLLAGMQSSARMEASHKERE